MIIGHRGASGYRPEHSRAAYQMAFAQGADAVEPDIVPTRDGVLVLRHESEIGTTTDVAGRPEFAARRTTKRVDGVKHTGWFTEDFTWAELSTLRARERLPRLRGSSARFDDEFPILRLADLFEIIDEAAETTGRRLRMVAEIKNAQHFAALGMPLDELFAAEVAAAGWNDDRLIIESFEPDVLQQVRARGIIGQRIFLVAAEGSPADQIARLGSEAPDYASYLTAAGLAALGGVVEGISVAKPLILRTDAATGDAQTTTLVDAAHTAGLRVFCWTLRPENVFLVAEHRRGLRKADFGDWESEFAMILRTGVDGIFVDHPDLGVLARQSLHLATAPHA